MAFWNKWFKSKDKQQRTVQAAVLRSVNDQENAPYFATAKDSSADDICSDGERSRLRAECRKILLDCPSAQHAARSLALSTYGSGPSLQLKTPDEVINTKVERLFSLWRKQTGYDITFFSAVQSLPSDGEAFFLLCDNPKAIGGLGIELIEPFRIVSRPGTAFKPDEFCGIKYDEYNQPVSYTVKRISPNPDIPHIFDYDDIPANRVEHLFIPVLAAQRRGLPLLQAAIQTLASLRKIEDATLSAVETAANISFLVESDYDPNIDPDQQLCGVEGAGGYQAFDTIKLPGRNSGVYLPSGMKASQMKAENPNVNFAAFRQDCLLGVGAAMGAPKNIILNDSSSYNYSSARLDAQTFERWAGILQGLCSRILDSHFKTWLSSMADDPEVSLLLSMYDSLDAIPFKWYFAQPMHIDRAKEANADVTLLHNNCLSLRDYYAKQGKDWRAELQQIALEKRMMNHLGITTDDVIETIEVKEDNDEGSNSKRSE